MLKEGVDDGSIRNIDISISAKAMLGAINWLSVWYRPAPDETEDDRQMLAERIVTTQIDGIRS